MNWILRPDILDKINSAIEYACVIPYFNGIRHLLRVKNSAGLSPFNQCFWLGYSFWTSFYFWGLGQYWSLTAQLVFMAAYAMQTTLTFRYRPPAMSEATT